VTDKYQRLRKVRHVFNIVKGEKKNGGEKRKGGRKSAAVFGKRKKKGTSNSSNSPGNAPTYRPFFPAGRSRTRKGLSGRYETLWRTDFGQRKGVFRPCRRGGGVRRGFWGGEDEGKGVYRHALGKKKERKRGTPLSSQCLKTPRLSFA